ncbi:MAG: hypothetical protein IJY58_00210 [Alphaproteobacteria bacterium]|nr:hypothetical protein [Alphaproteobacteria bacterium]
MEIKEQDILDTIQSLRGTPSHPQPDLSVAPAVVRDTLTQSDENRVGISVMVSVGYKSMTGNIKNRDFLIRRIIQNKNEYFLDGLAIDIHAPRLIKVSQISFIQDKVTRHTYSNPYQFLQDILGVQVQRDLLTDTMTDFAKAIQETGQEITVLMYLVAIDGVRSSIERKKVLEYIKRRVPYLNYDEDKMNDYLISMAPDDDSFSMAFQRVLKKGIVVIQPLFETVLSIIMADEQIHAKERAFLARLIDLLKQDGYVFNLPQSM